MGKSSVLKWSKFFGVLAVSAMFWACSSSDDKSVAGGSTEDAGIIAIKDLDVAGVTQKGPFVKGSAVTVQGIDCKTLKQTDEHFEGEVKSDKGDFTVKEVSLKSTCALFEVTGLYRSEITGKKSSKELTLRALTDLKDRENVNINILTNLEYERLLHLVTEKGKTFAEAKAQAEAEVLAAFDIAGSFEDFENLNIFESGDGNAALLAVSVMMQAETDDAGLAKRLDKFTDSFAETGNWKDSATKATIADWAADAIAGNGLDSIRKNIESWDIGDTVAAFEKYITAEFPDTVVYSSSSADRSSSSAKANAGSEYDPATNTLKDLRDGKTYKTVKIGNQVWMAENLNFKTDSSFCYNDSAKYCSKYGRLYTWTAAMNACPDGWRLPSETDFVNLIKAVGGEKDAGTKLKSTSGWNDYEGESGNGADAFGFSALPAGAGNAGHYGGMNHTTDFWGSTECGTENSPEPGDGCAYEMYLDYRDADVYMPSYAAKDLVLSVRCIMGDGSAVDLSSSSGVTPKSSGSETIVSSSSAEVQPNSSETESSSSSGDDKMNCSALLEGETDWNWNVPKECRFNPDIDYGTMIDTRDNKQYKTVKIGDQVWMAENLNFDPGQGGSGDAKYDWSWCHNNKAEHCDVAGRFYTWAAAIDSVKLATDADKTMDCGYGKECGLDSAGSATLIQGICPDGWHLPNNGEWDSLFTAVGGSGKAGTLLKSQTGWYGNGNGPDAFGFTALSVGRSYSYASFDFDGLYAYFWSATENDSSYAYGMYLYYRGDDVGAGLFDSYKNYGFSVRCVQD